MFQLAARQRSCDAQGRGNLGKQDCGAGQSGSAERVSGRKRVFRQKFLEHERWYTFYASQEDIKDKILLLNNNLASNKEKLQQVAAEIGQIQQGNFLKHISDMGEKEQFR